jgi:glycosyltransferase involved in cell wall biosynthesis
MRNGGEEALVDIETENTEPSHSLPISVVICTRNRAELLSRALETVCDQDLDSCYYEVIVVDNGSADPTSEVVETLTREYPNVRYCREEKVGLSHSRNRGFREARGVYIGYLDDDAKVPSDWLSKAKRIIERESPAAFGGPFYPFYDSPKPRWFDDKYGSRESAECARFLKLGESLSGGNFFIRREILLQLGGFETDLGMTGKSIAYGEETHLQDRIFDTMPGRNIYYDPTLLIRHLVRADKMSLIWRIMQNFSRGRSETRMRRHSGTLDGGPLRAFKHFLIAALYLVFNLTYGLLTYDRKRFPFVQNYLYEAGLSPLEGIGRFYERACALPRRRIGQRKEGNERG